MRSDFAVFILTYNRPDNLLTYETLMRSGYTGKVYIVCDDSDPSLNEYRKKFGDALLVFSKDEIAREFDQGDNFTDRRTIFFARNASWKLAEDVGVRYFIELDDDYTSFLYRSPDKFGVLRGWNIRKIDKVFGLMVDFVESTGASTLAMSQGGDHISGDRDLVARVTRKAMNSFVCDVQRPFPFMGRINEDVNAYVSLGNRGKLFFTYWTLQLNQKQTQQTTGGMTDVYLDSGTYLKSFYSVMYAPSCVKVKWLASMRRFHHSINWNNAVPKIISERYRAA